MALVAAALPPPVQVVRSTAAYLLAPTPLDDGVAFLTVPRQFGGPAVVARISGDRLVAQRASGVRTLFDFGCEAAVECNAVRAPVGDGLDVVYGMPADEGGGYVARAGVNGRSLLVAGDETSSGALLTYTAAAGMTVYASKGTIVARIGAAAPVTLVKASASGGEVRGVAATAAGVAWISRAGARGLWYVGVKVGDALATSVTDRRAGVRLGAPALADDGTIAFSRRVPLSRTRARFEIVTIRPGAAERVIATSPPVKVADGDLLPRVAIRGTTVVYRLRDGSGGRWEAIRATDLATGATRTVVRLGRRAARMSDPAIDQTRILWSQADFVSGRFVRSRILKVRVSL